MANLPRETRVLQAVVSLVDRLLEDFDVVDLLVELTEHCADLIDVASVGLLLADSRQQLQLMAATTKTAHDLELFQLQADEGPCLDCFATGRPISVADLSAERQRWPQFAATASEAGFASVHAVPMRAGRAVLGALGLFGTRVGQLNDADILVGRTLAHVACVAILQGHPPTPDTIVSPLRSALLSRVVVDQAIGRLHELLSLSTADAFALMRRYARTNDQHLTEVARQLMTDPAGRPPILGAIATLANAPS
jgi:GAF domain-containing protein